VRTTLVILATLLGPAPFVAAQQQPTAADSATALDVHRAWWRAFTVGDTARVAALADRDFTVTLSTATTLDRPGVVADAENRGDSALVRLAWLEGSVRFVGDAAVVTSRVAETIGPNETHLRYLSVLRRVEGGWRLVAGQSTRVPLPGREVPLPPAVVQAYTGRYRTPAGGIVTIVARDSSLALVGPGGGAERLRPVSPAVFELATGKSIGGLVRLVFERDASGQVIGISRLAAGDVARFVRIP
jgi:hypothetical protein